MPFLNQYLCLTYVHLSSQKLTELLTGALSVAEPHLLVEDTNTGGWSLVLNGFGSQLLLPH